jgi:hypothetical protein
VGSAVFKPVVGAKAPKLRSIIHASNGPEEGSGTSLYESRVRSGGHLWWVNSSV